MASYLGINDYKIGAPPNWRDSRFWKLKLFGKKFDMELYIAEVEDYIKKAHQRHWETICEYDNVTAERGEKSIEMERNILQVAEVLTEWADRYRLNKADYDHKYGKTDESN